MSVNKAILIGNLGQDPEIKDLGNGRKVANLRIATSESWKDKDSGERKERTEWHSVAIFVPGLIGVIEANCRKGSQVYIEGQMQTRKYEKNGQDHYATDVVVQGPNSSFRMLDRRGEQGGAPAGGSNQGSGQSGGNQGGSQGGNFYDDSEDIPF